jgi:hypothetical protein
MLTIKLIYADSTPATAMAGFSLTALAPGTLISSIRCARQHAICSSANL